MYNKPGFCGKGGAVPVWEEFFSLLNWGAVGFFCVAAVAVGISIFYFHRARRAPYYILREQARRRGARYLSVAGASLLVGLALLYLHAHSPAVPPPATPSPFPPTATVAAASATPPPTPTSRPAFTPLPSPTPTRRPTATPPFIPTPTPAYPLPETALSPLPGAVAAGPEAEITFLTFALGEENGQPVDPGVEFPPGDHRVYFFFEYQGMAKNVVWTYGWYRDGQYLDGATRLWVLGRAGVNYLYYKPPGGYEPGVYEVRVWIEDRFQTSAQFLIQQPSE